MIKWNQSVLIDGSRDMSQKYTLVNFWSGSEPKTQMCSRLRTSLLKGSAPLLLYNTASVSERFECVLILLFFTWCCTERSRPWRCAAACYPWWRRGSLLLSRWRRTGPVSRWSPAWTGPDPERSRGTRCRPAAGRSTSAGGRCSPCSPETQAVWVFGICCIVFCYLLALVLSGLW